MRDRPGFSLVELLVVIAVLAILAAIIIPVANQSLRRADSTTCLNNLRQLYTGISLYASENGMTYPPTTGAAVEETYGWWYMDGSPLASYLGGDDELTSLSMCPLNRTDNIVPRSGVKGYPYTVNYNIMATTLYPIRNAFTLPDSSKILLMADSQNSDAWGWGFDDVSESSGGWSRVAEPHGGEGHFLWCDGHVTSQSKASISPQSAYNIRYQ